MKNINKIRVAKPDSFIIYYRRIMKLYNTYDGMVSLYHDASRVQ